MQPRSPAKATAGTAKHPAAGGGATGLHGRGAATRPEGADLIASPLGDAIKVASVPPASTLSVTGRAEGWLRVQLKDRPAFIAAEGLPAFRKIFDRRGERGLQLRYVCAELLDGVDGVTQLGPDLGTCRSRRPRSGSERAEKASARLWKGRTRKAAAALPPSEAGWGTPGAGACGERKRTYLLSTREQQQRLRGETSHE